MSKCSMLAARSATRSLIILGVIGLAACGRDQRSGQAASSDPPPTHGPPPPQGRPPSPVTPGCRTLPQIVASAESIGGEIMMLPRYDALDVRALGVLKPGEPFDLELSACALVATADAELRVYLPDVVIEAARAEHGGSVPEGLRIPECAKWHARLGAGETVRRRVAVTISTAGYYRVTFQVETGPGRPSNADGRAFDELASREVWLEIADSGGGVVDHPPNPVVERPARVPPRGTRGGPGPLRSGDVVKPPVCIAERRAR